MTTSVLWLRRDLRLADSPALLAARDAGKRVVPLFVLDDALRRPAGPARLTFLYRCLRELEERTDGALRVLTGRPEDVVPRVVRDAGATSVHVSSDHAPYGRVRDERVRAALGDVPLVATGSPYAVTPGVLRKADGEPFRVYSPYFRAWRERGVHSPALTPRVVPWSDGDLPTDGVPPDAELGAVALPPAGERAALERWRHYRATGLSAYAQVRNAPGADGTSVMSAYLKYGCIHPRTMLADLGDGEGARKLRGELAWRDFYADVLWHRPSSAREELVPAMAALEYAEGPEADRRFEAWATGRTGYPFVDAGMRQLLGEAWVHNRVRMVVASFLVKDLHVHWRRGARHFMHHLRDGDLASNQHGWQWVAGTGTDAAPYFRVFNPVTQGKEHDPDGVFVKRWVPELRDVDGRAVHEPWTLPVPPADYPERVVDHQAERAEALRRYA
ncbi:MAG TPA: deoxyribodipyrimidine photo-lyase, partial [Mycobacteriales bacterium]|nr:deoxyribodipyrimidine photo-lyase [Mycobacteriales bacterium]